MTEHPQSRLVAFSALAALLVLVLVTGCTSGPAQRSRPADPTAPSTGDLRASVAQFRFDEGTRRLSAGVTNDSDRDIRVTRARVEWAGLAFDTARLPGEVVRPGQTAAFTAVYGAPRCGVDAPGDPVLLARVDGRTLRLPLHVDSPGLLERLQVAACGRERLARTADVRLRLSRGTVQVAGEEYVAGEVLVRRRPGTTEQVRLVDLGGSVLIDLVPRAGRTALPAQLAPSADLLRLPVLLGSAHRCDGHALGQSSQTFLISGYLRLPGAPTQRVIFPLATADRVRLVALIDRDCGVGS